MNQIELMKRNKSFTLKCLYLANTLPDTKLGNHLRGQLIRSSTSVTANYRAARLAQSRAAFISKLSIVIEEADESEFWIELAIDLNILEGSEARMLKKEAHELTSIYIATRKALLHGKN
jgi:four helix bundle protein